MLACLREEVLGLLLSKVVLAGQQGIQQGVKLVDVDVPTSRHALEAAAAAWYGRTEAGR